MSDDVFIAATRRVRSHCVASGQRIVRLMFHGGEPLLAGVPVFSSWLDAIESELSDIVNVRLAVQTNATLIDDQWARLFLERGVEVGVSLDGPVAINDRFRIDHAGNGSYAKVVQGINTLRCHGVAFSLLSVIHLGANGTHTYRHLRDMHPQTINFLFPDHNYQDIVQVRANHGPTPIFDFLRPIIDEWALAPDAGEVPLLRNICRLILGGESRSDMFGNPPLGFVFIEANGDIEGLDVLRLDGEGIASCGANVLVNDFTTISERSDFHDRMIFRGLPLPRACASCPESDTCAGGYLPHRYSANSGFDNPSVWCADILLLFGYLRALLQVDVAETRLRHRLLAEMAGG